MNGTADIEIHTPSGIVRTELSFIHSPDEIKATVEKIAQTGVWTNDGDGKSNFIPARIISKLVVIPRTK